MPPAKSASPSSSRKRAVPYPSTKPSRAVAKKVPVVDDEDDDMDDNVAMAADPDFDQEDDDEDPAPLKKVRAKRVIPPKKSALPTHVLPITPMLAHKYDLEKGVDPTGWHISEKLDGVRAIWTGKTFLSRTGTRFYAPEWFTRKLPKDMVLDGELFTCRGGFQDCVGIVRTMNQPDRWKFSVNYKVFDAPLVKGGFEARMKELEKLFKKLKGPDGKRTPWIELLKHEECKSKEHLLELLEEWTKDGAEGIMLREPNSEYEQGRSRSLLKVKKFLDCDAVVTGYTAGTGKNAGVVGALEVEMLSGVGGTRTGCCFKVGSGLTDAQRQKPPKIGATIIVKYFELSKSGSPRFPTYGGERAD